MGHEVRVYPQSLRRAKGGFDDGSDQLKLIFERLASRLSAEGKCWGADKMGQAFEKDYLPGAKEIQDAAPTMAKILGEIATSIDKMAQNYIGAEDGSTVK